MLTDFQVLTKEESPYPFYVHGNGEAARYTWPGREKWSGLGMSRKGDTAVSVAHEPRMHSLWEFPLKPGNAAAPVQLFETGPDAVYFPCLSPSGQRLGYLETPGEDYPPRRNGTARLCVWSRSGEGWTRETVDISCRRAPWDWADEEAVTVQQPDGALVHVTLASGEVVERIDANGSYPRWSPDGASLAYYAGRDTSGVYHTLICRRDGQNREVLALRNPRGLAWTPDGEGVVVAQELGKWNVTVSLANAASGEATKLFSRPYISGLEVLGAAPQWPAEPHEKMTKAGPDFYP